MSLCVELDTYVGNFHLQVSFQGENGETVALLGASGSGKTLTLQCIAGTLTPQKGHISLNGHVLFDHKRGINLPPQRRRVGYLFQQYALFPHRTVLGNFQVATSDSARIHHLLHGLGLAEHQSKYPHQLSGGQRQRVALGRMLAANPHIILLDEPFSALDSHVKGQVSHLLRQHLQSFSGPCVLVSHNREEVCALSQQVCVLDGGISQPIQPTHDLFTSPQTVAACRLSGCPNLSPAVATALGEKEAPQLGIRLPSEWPTSHVAIFPHHIQLTQGEGVPCTVVQVEQHPFSHTITLSHSGGTLVMERPAQESPSLYVGQAVWVSLPPDYLLAVSP